VRPLYLRHDQRSRRRTAAQEACYRPTVSALPRLRCNQRSNPWHGGLGPHVMHPARRFLCAEKANRRVKSAPLPAVVRLFAPTETDSPVSGTGAWAHESVSLGIGFYVQRSLPRAAAKDGEVKFSKLMQRLEPPHAWPNKAIKCGGHGSVSRGDRRGSRRDHGRTSSNCINGRAGAASQSPIKLWPHLPARRSLAAR
jgi:hypothetical protein